MSTGVSAKCGEGLHEFIQQGWPDMCSLASHGESLPYDLL